LIVGILKTEKDKNRYFDLTKEEIIVFGVLKNKIVQAMEFIWI